MARTGDGLLGKTDSSCLYADEVLNGRCGMVSTVEYRMLTTGSYSDVLFDKGREMGLAL